MTKGCGKRLAFSRFTPSPHPPLRCCTCAATIKDPRGNEIRNGLKYALVQCSKCRKLPHPSY